MRNTDWGATTYYLHSTVLGGQVVAELEGNGTSRRGYVYAGGQLVALQQYGEVNWAHQDPVNKSQRITNAAGTVIAGIELDPWGGATGRSWNNYRQPHEYTTYDRGQTGDESLFRRYHGWFSRFAHPDPYDGSYNIADPQSLNRYAYVQNDPVNFVDPSGLDDYFIPAWQNGWDRFANPIENFLNGAMRGFVADYNWFVREEEGGVEFDGFPPFSFGWRGPRRLPLTPPGEPEKPDPDPCAGVRPFDLDYKRVRKYQRGAGNQPKNIYVIGISMEILAEQVSISVLLVW